MAEMVKTHGKAISKMAVSLDDNPSPRAVTVILDSLKSIEADLTSTVQKLGCRMLDCAPQPSVSTNRK